VDHRDRPGDDDFLEDAPWIASRSRSLGADSRGPLVRNVSTI
jgi:hypothetical protein